MSSPRFSVFMPSAGERPGWLARAIDSVRAQTFAGWELCIYDNAPEPQLLDLDSRMRYVHGPADGVADAFNRALALCEGEIVHPLADDDRLAPDALWVVDREIGKHEWLVGRTQTETSDGEPLKLLGRPPDARKLQHSFGLGGAVYWRRRLTEKLGAFNTDFTGAADWELYRRFAEHTPGAYVDRVLYIATNHPGMDSRANRSRQKAAAARLRA